MRHPSESTEPVESGLARFLFLRNRLPLGLSGGGALARCPRLLSSNRSSGYQLASLAFLYAYRRCSMEITAVELEISPKTDILFFSKVLCGLEGLRNGRVRIGNTASEIVARLCVHLRGRENPLVIALDLHDMSDRFEPYFLEHCDLYAKRSYSPEFVEPKWRNKVIPFGLNYSVRSSFVIGAALRTAMGRLATDALGFALSLRQLARTAAPQEFEWAAQMPVENKVLFQTRVWPQEQVGPDNAERLNSFRVALIRALRREFGSRFTGGLYPSAFAKEHFPDLVTSFPSRPADFIRWSRKSLISIYTPGLNRSVAFKLGEYLAASKCIVMTPIESQLPAPLREGRHFLGFQTVDECILACDRLLTDPSLASDLRNEAWSYYRAHVEPVAHLRELVHAGLSRAHVLPGTSCGAQAPEGWSSL